MDPSWEAEQGEGQDFDRLIARDLKYFSGSHFSFIGRRCEAVEQKLATYKLDPIKNDENAPNLPLKTMATHLIHLYFINLCSNHDPPHYERKLYSPRPSQITPTNSLSLTCGSRGDIASRRDGGL